MQTEARRFEFAQLADERYRRLRGGRVSTIGIMLLVLGVEAASFLKLAGLLPGFKGGISEPTLVVIVGGFVIIAMALAFYFMTFGVHPPTSLVMDATGLRLFFPDGRSRVFVWKDGRIRLTMIESVRVKSRSGQASGAPPPERRYAIVGLRPRQSPISAQAFNRVLTECRDRGLRIDVRPHSGSPFNQTVYRIVAFG